VSEIPFQVGIGVRDITPSDEWIRSGRIYLWGFASRSQAAEGIFQQLSARGMVIQDYRGEKILLLAVDLAAIDAELSWLVRNRISQVLGISPDRICINLSHTHGAPSILQAPTWQTGFDAPFLPYRGYLLEQIVDAARVALDDLQPARLWLNRGETDIGFDRHFRREESPDRVLDVLKVTDLHGRTRSVAFFASCHPVCMGDYNFVNTDFPGFARDQVEAETGGMALFFQGFAGTTNPKDLDAGRTGRKLAGEVLSLLDQPSQQLHGSIRAANNSVRLPFQPVPDGEIVSKARSAGGMFSRWAGMVASNRQSLEDSLPVELQGFRLSVSGSVSGSDRLSDSGSDSGSDRISGNDPAWYILTCSHEVSSDLAQPVRNLRKAHRVTTLGYCNTQFCYLPSDAVLAQPVPCRQFPFCEENYEGGISFAWYGHHAILEMGVDKAFLHAHGSLLEHLEAADSNPERPQ